MTESPEPNTPLSRLRLGIVLRVREDACEIATAGEPLEARFAQHFPRPRTERVSPGNLVAIADPADRAAVVVWRWYDAVVLGERDGLVRLWEPAHGEVGAVPRPSYVRAPAGGRAYLSAGLPGADWWVAGPATAEPEAADVELDAVERLYTEHNLWDGI